MSEYDNYFTDDENVRWVKLTRAKADIDSLERELSEAQAEIERLKDENRENDYLVKEAMANSIDDGISKHKP